MDLGTTNKSGKDSAGVLVNWQLVFYGTDSHPLSDEENESHVPAAADEEAAEAGQDESDLDQGSILQNSVSAEKLSDKV
jgi:hypothetical protein